ncbi:hypothetical protein QQ045_013492 [Rhodiola kirilowii]
MSSKGTRGGKGVSVVGGNSDDDDFVDPPSKRRAVETPKGKGKAVMGTKTNKGGTAKCIEEPDVKKHKMLTRNSPSQMRHAMKNLTVEQAQLLDQLGFGGIRRIQIKDLPGDLTRWLVVNFDAERSCLKMTDYDIPINKMVLHRIFGLPCGGKPITLPSRTHMTNPMVNKWRDEMGLETGSVKPQEVAHHMVQNYDVERLDWFMMKFVVLFSATLLGAIKDVDCNLTILHAFNSTSEIGLEIERTDRILDVWSSEVIRRRVICELDEGGLGLGQLIPKYRSMGVYRDQQRQSFPAEGGVSGASSSKRRKNDSMGEAGSQTAGTAAGKVTAPVRCSQRKKPAAAPDMQTPADGDRVEEVERQSSAVESPARVLRSSLREGTAPVKETVGRKLPPSWAFNKFDEQENITVEDEDNTDEDEEGLLDDVIVTQNQLREGAANRSSAQRGKTRFLPHRRAASTAAKRIRVEVNALNTDEEAAAPVEYIQDYSSDYSSMNEEVHNYTMDDEPQPQNFNYEEMVDNVMRENPVCNVEKDPAKKGAGGTNEPSKKSGMRTKHTAPPHVLEDRLKRRNAIRGLSEQEIAIAEVRELVERVKMAFLDYVCVSSDISLKYPENRSLQQIENDVRHTLGIPTCTPMNEDVHAREERAERDEGPSAAIFSKKIKGQKKPEWQQTWTPLLNKM